MPSGIAHNPDKATCVADISKPWYFWDDQESKPDFANKSLEVRCVGKYNFHVNTTNLKC